MGQPCTSSAKGRKDFLKLRASEADKVRYGQRHFEAIGVDFSVVVTLIMREP